MNPLVIPGDVCERIDVFLRHRAPRRGPSSDTDRFTQTREPSLLPQGAHDEDAATAAPPIVNPWVRDIASLPKSDVADTIREHP